MTEFQQSIMQHAKSVTNYTPNWSYVYVGLIDGVPAYVGKGCKSRYKHLTTAASSISEVKEAKAEGKVFDVYILCDWLHPDEALRLEKSTIKGLKPYLNKENKVTHQF